MKNGTMPSVITEHKNIINIIGDNVLYNNGIITAYYIIPLTNYSTTTGAGVEFAVNDLANMIRNLTTNYPNLQFNIERIDKTIRKSDVVRNLYNTIKLYAPDFEMPMEFTDKLFDDRQSYCLLGVDIQQNSITDVEEFTLWETIKAVIKGAVETFASIGNMNANPEQILKIEENIYRTIRYKCVRASKELVFYHFVSKLFPCYDISYDSLSYINDDTFEPIMGSVQNTISDNFGWFEMHNEGVSIFGEDSETTYGCMLTVHEFPKTIDTMNFPLNLPNMVTTIKCLKKDEATTKIKRMRGSMEFEENDAIKSASDEEHPLAQDERLSSIRTNIYLANQAISLLDNTDAIMVEFSTHILVWAETLQQLKEDVVSVMTQCKNRQILLSKSLHQASDFLEVYVNRKPTKMPHLTLLEFPLSFQQNAGATVGDDENMRMPNGQVLWSPSIGDDLT